MAYRIDFDAPLQDEARRIAVELLEEALRLSVVITRAQPFTDGTMAL